MKKFFMVFTTVSCFALAALNLYLNYRLYELNETRSYAAAPDAISEEDTRAEETAAIEESVAPVMSHGSVRVNTAADDAPLYTLGVMNGFVAVYYGSTGDMVRELTSVSVEAMPSDERLRLSMGIPVYSEEQLAKLLQDYGS